MGKQFDAFTVGRYSVFDLTKGLPRLLLVRVTELAECLEILGRYQLRRLRVNYTLAYVAKPN